MKLLTSCLVLIIILISFVRCSINSYQTNNQVGDIEKREEVHEENSTQIIAPIQLSAIIKTCRKDYKLTPAGDCRRVL